MNFLAAGEGSARRRLAERKLLFLIADVRFRAQERENNGPELSRDTKDGDAKAPKNPRGRSLHVAVTRERTLTLLLTRRPPASIVYFFWDCLAAISCLRLNSCSKYGQNVGACQ